MGKTEKNLPWQGGDISVIDREVVVSAQGLSYIENHEQAEAKKLIDKQFIELTKKPFGYRAAGAYIVCKIYIRPDEIKEIVGADGKKSTLWLPPQITDGDKFHSVSALVCGIGPDAFIGFDSHGHKRFPSGPICRIGDWINIPRNNSYMFQYRGVALAQLFDDYVLGVVEDPRDLTPINQKPLI